MGVVVIRGSWLWALALALVEAAGVVCAPQTLRKAGPALARAISFGSAVADAVIMLRGEDGSMAAASAGSARTALGEWRPTPAKLLPSIGQGKVCGLLSVATIC